MEANQDMGGFKVTNMATPTQPGDAATKAYVDAEGFPETLTVYVRKDGSPDGNGTRNQPFDTVTAGIQKAIDDGVTPDNPMLLRLGAGGWFEDTILNIPAGLSVTGEGAELTAIGHETNGDPIILSYGSNTIGVEFAQQFEDMTFGDGIEIDRDPGLAYPEFARFTFMSCNILGSSVNATGSGLGEEQIRITNCHCNTVSVNGMSLTLRTSRMLNVNLSDIGVDGQTQVIHLVHNNRGQFCNLFDDSLAILNNNRFTRIRLDGPDCGMDIDLASTPAFPSNFQFINGATSAQMNRTNIPKGMNVTLVDGANWANAPLNLEEQLQKYENMLVKLAWNGGIPDVGGDVEGMTTQTSGNPIAPTGGLLYQTGALEGISSGFLQTGSIKHVTGDVGSSIDDSVSGHIILKTGKNNGNGGRSGGIYLRLGDSSTAELSEPDFGWLQFINNDANQQDRGIYIEGNEVTLNGISGRRGVGLFASVADYESPPSDTILLKASAGIKMTGAMSQGFRVIASGLYSHAEGFSDNVGVRGVASGDYSHSEGVDCNSDGQASHSEGLNTSSTGQASHSEGKNTEASNVAAHVEGEETTASGHASHAEGTSGEASGYASHSEGTDCTAAGTASHAAGTGTIANGDYQTVVGQFNVAVGTPTSPVATDEINSVGNGANNGSRNTAWAILRDGRMKYQHCGLASLVLGAVTVASSVVTASSRIFLSVQDISATPGFVSIANIVPGVSFDIISSVGTDDSDVAWMLVESF
jgi:hypothetical protein